MSPDLVKRYLFMGKQLVTDRHGDHQWVLPDLFGTYAIANFGRVSELYREIAGPQPAQLLSQRDFGQSHLDSRACLIGFLGDFSHAGSFISNQNGHHNAAYQQNNID